VARASLPPPIRAELPVAPPEPPPAPPGPPTLAPAEAVAPAPDELLAADPANVTPLLERAARLAAAGEYPAAQRDYDRVLRAAPAHGEALTGLGVVLSRRGLWNAAVTLLRRAAEADAGRAAAW